MKQEQIRLRAAAYQWRAAAATVRGFVEGTSPETMARAMYPDDQVTPLVLRAATTQATTTDPLWAGPLAMQSRADAIEDVVALSALGRLLAAGALNVDLGRLATLIVPGRVTNVLDAGQFVQEGKPVQVRQLNVTGAPLRPRKLEVIVTVTRELTEASNIEDVVRVILTEAAGIALDAAIFSATAATPARSAGILNGLVALAPSAAGGFEGAGEDLGALTLDLATRAGGQFPFFIAAPSQATTLRYWAGGQFGTGPGSDILPVAASAGLPDKTVVCLEPRSFVCTIGQPSFSASRVATLHQEDTTPADIVAGAAATPVKSMFQIDAIALKMTLWADWAMRAPHVSFMDAVTW
ncbi:MAG TPA: hypothetical protein VGH47_04490 [Xanthobacteraceae bacterium]|jgi:hypothetical protein